MKRLFVGIDPSVTSTGVVILDEKLLVQLARTFSSRSGPSWRQAVDRYIRLGSQIIGELPLPDELTMIRVLVEDYAPSRFMKSVIPTIEFGAMLRSALFRYESFGDVVVEFVSPAELKKFSTGKGNASKIELATAWVRHDGVDFKKPAKGDKLELDDLYDAYGLARMCAAAHGVDSWIPQVRKLNKEQIALAQKAVFGSVAVPAEKVDFA